MNDVLYVVDHIVYGMIVLIKEQIQFVDNTEMLVEPFKFIIYVLIAFSIIRFLELHKLIYSV
jgi:hypothetical protein